MDARAVLTAQGWRGDGHALREGGLKRQILAAHKLDLKGLGHARPGSSYNTSGVGAGGVAGGGLGGAGEAGKSGWWDDVFSSKLKNITVAAANAAVGATDALGEVVAAAKAQAEAAVGGRDAATQTGVTEAAGGKAPAKRNADVLARSLGRHFTHGGTLRGNDDAELARMRQANAAAVNASASGGSGAKADGDRKKAKRKRGDDGDADAAAALAAIVDTPPTSSASNSAGDADIKSKRVKKSREINPTEEATKVKAPKKAKSQSSDAAMTAVQPDDAAAAADVSTPGKPVRKHKLKIKADKAQRAEKLLAAALAATSTHADGAAGEAPSSSSASLKERELEASLARLSDDKLGAAVGKMRKEDSRARKAARAEKKRRKAQRNVARELKKQRKRAEGKREKTKTKI